MAFNSSTVIRQYSDPAEEARTCRADCALFDFSFIARAHLSGVRAQAVIARLAGRPLHNLAPGQIRYAVREDGNGYLVSDLTIWRHEGHIEVMSGRGEDVADLMQATLQDCPASDLSPTSAIFAVQGPGSLAALARYMDVGAVARLSYFAFTEAKLQNIPCIVGRLGYTGELGFEIVLPRADARHVWQTLARTIRPAGFAAADILRIEAGFVLFANQFRVPVTASEAGLERFAAPRGPKSDQGVKLVCFAAIARDIPVPWQPEGPIWRPTQGTIAITSACRSAHAGGSILGLGFARRSDVETARPLHDPRGMFTDIRLVSLPFVDPQKLRPRAALPTPSHR
jgi:aminomethyltransferase